MGFFAFYIKRCTNKILKTSIVDMAALNQVPKVILKCNQRPKKATDYCIACFHDTSL